MGLELPKLTVHLAAMSPALALTFMLTLAAASAASADLEASIFEAQAAALAFPNAEQVESSEDPTVLPRRVVLGALEKVNQVIKPERSLTVQGGRFTRTWYLPKSRRTEEVSDFYKEQLARRGQLLFSCTGRTCGSSNYWANRIMESAILYGPEQYQRYHVAWVDDAYLLVYIGQRATRKIYVHLERITAAGAGAVDDRGAGAEVLAGLEGQGRYVIEGKTLTADQLASISSAMTRLGQPLVIVVHDARRSGETLAESLERTSQRAADLAGELRERGAEGLMLDARGLGPLAPSEVHAGSRIELLLLKP